MPRVDDRILENLTSWVQNIDEKKIIEICQDYGINPEPSINRLKVVKNHGPTPVDLHLNSLWCGLSTF
jgi:hypothetical protein